MNKDVLETQWVQAKEFLREKWPRLTEEDLRQINGRFDQLSDKLQQRYGYTSAQAEEEIRKWNFDRTSKPSFSNVDKPYARQSDRPVRREEESSALKWLLALALPLLLLALYLGTARTPESYNENQTAPNTTNQAMPSGAAVNEGINVSGETAADRPIAQAIRQALASNNFQFQSLRNINISANNGVVTISGTVANAQEQDRILNILNRIPSVKKVNNQLEISR
jgi:uncharacterized protein YjbJ (UPF0337 family)